MERKTKIFLMFSVLLVIVVSVLFWMLFDGGCLDFIRVRLYGGNAKIDNAALCFLMLLMLGEVCFKKFFINNKNNLVVIINAYLKLMSVKLLI